MSCPVKIDREKCIGCGLCTGECILDSTQPYFTLVIGHPDVKFERIPPRKAPSITRK